MFHYFSNIRRNKTQDSLDCDKKAVYFTSSSFGPNTFHNTLFLNTFSPRVYVLFTSESEDV